VISYAKISEWRKLANEATARAPIAGPWAEDLHGLAEAVPALLDENFHLHMQNAVLEQEKQQAEQAWELVKDENERLLAEVARLRGPGYCTTCHTALLVSTTGREPPSCPACSMTDLRVERDAAVTERDRLLNALESLLSSDSEMPSHSATLEEAESCLRAAGR
jgi:hypothetical protein